MQILSVRIWSSQQNKIKKTMNNEWKQEELNENNVIPSALDKNVASKVAEAIANAARKTGVARV